MVLGEPSLLTLWKTQVQTLPCDSFLSEPHGEHFEIQVGFNEPEFVGLDPAAIAPGVPLRLGSVKLRTTDLD